MIISRMLFRISFFGGGTDYPNRYRDNGGSVLNTIINKYCYISSRYPPARSGIGSSSAFTVGFLNSQYALTGQIGQKRLGSNAIYVEQQIIGEDVGSQDQAAAAFVGLNKMEFNGKENFIVQPVSINQQKITSLQNHLILFFTNFSRTASEIACEQIKNTPDKGEITIEQQNKLDNIMVTENV